MRFHSTISSLLLLLLYSATLSTITTAQEAACIGLTDNDEVCITKAFPTCSATWNGIACESCTICEDAATAYHCEVAAIMGSDKDDCKNNCANVECNAGCIGCQIAKKDIKAAVEDYELQQAQLLEEQQQQQALLEEGVEETFPVPAPNTTTTETTTTEDINVIPVVIDNNTNEQITTTEDTEKETPMRNSTSEESEDIDGPVTTPTLPTESDANNNNNNNNSSSTETETESASGEQSGGEASTEGGSGAVTFGGRSMVGLAFAALVTLF